MLKPFIYIFIQFSVKINKICDVFVGGILQKTPTATSNQPATIAPAETSVEAGALVVNVMKM